MTKIDRGILTYKSRQYEVEPCPFCGEFPALYRDLSADDNWWETKRSGVFPDLGSEPPPVGYIACSNEKCSARPATRSFRMDSPFLCDGFFLPVLAWNSRVGKRQAAKTLTEDDYVFDKSKEYKARPCPFCGGMPIIDHRLGTSEFDLGRKGYQVLCSWHQIERQWCSIAPATEWYPTLDDALDAWNTRNGQFKTRQPKLKKAARKED